MTATPAFYRAEDAAGLPGGVTAADVLRFNSPLPELALGVAGVGALLARLPLPGAVRAMSAAGSAAALWFVVSSALATRIVFETSGLTTYRWLTDTLGAPPARWLNLTTGFDDTTGTLARLWPDSELLAFDRFDPDSEHEAALLRARAIRPPQGISIRPGDALPIADASVDAAFLLMSAHEVRRPRSRAKLFAEAARCLRVGGRLVVTEHARDIANAVAFGPGVLHFCAPQTWREAGRTVGLELVDEQRRTPFVRVFVFERP